MLATTGLNSPIVHLWDARSGRVAGELEGPPRSRPGVIAFSPDGRRFVVGENSGDVRVWDIESRREVFALEKVHENKRGVTSVAFAPDGKQFATGGEFGWVRLWNSDDGQSEGTFQAGTAAPDAKGGGPTFSIVIALAFSPDGQSLAAGAGFQPSHVFAGGGGDAEGRAVRNPRGESILVWSLDPRKRVQVIPSAHPTELVSLAWADEGRTLISGGNAVIPLEKFGKPYNAKNVRVAEFKLWDVETGKLIQELKTEEREAGNGGVAVSQDGRVAACGIEEKMLLYELPSGRLLRRIKNPGWSGQNGLAISPDGLQVVADKSGQLGVWDTATGGSTARFSQLLSHSRDVMGATFSPDGNRIYTGSLDGTIRAWDSLTGAQLYERAIGDEPLAHALALSPDGDLLAAGGVNDRSKRAGTEIFLWKAESGDLVRRLESPATPDQNTRQMTFSADGHRLAVANWVGRQNAEDIKILDVETGRLLKEIRPQEWATNLRSLAFSTDGTRLYSVAGQPAAVSVWDANTGELSGGFLLDEDATPEQAKDAKYRAKVWLARAAFTHDTSQVVVSRDEKIVIWDLRRQRPVRTILMPGHKKGRYIGLSRDGRLLATAEVNYGGEVVTNTIRVWDLKSGRQIAQFASTDGLATVLAFSPDNKRLVAGTVRGTALVWEVAAEKK
jgi:WD40 repeat protein